MAENLSYFIGIIETVNTGDLISIRLADNDEILHVNYEDVLHVIRDGNLVCTKGIDVITGDKILSITPYSVVYETPKLF